jgi:hypothetical protein
MKARRPAAADAPSIPAVPVPAISVRMEAVKGAIILADQIDPVLAQLTDALSGLKVLTEHELAESIGVLNGLRRLRARLHGRVEAYAALAARRAREAKG